MLHTQKWGARSYSELSFEVFICNTRAEKFTSKHCDVEIVFRSSLSKLHKPRLSSKLQLLWLKEYPEMHHIRVAHTFPNLQSIKIYKNPTLRNPKRAQHILWYPFGRRSHIKRLGTLISVRLTFVLFRISCRFSYKHFPLPASLVHRD